MRNHTFVSTYPVIFRCALLSAAVVHRKFRAMDVLYYMDYYASLLEYTSMGSDIKAQPVQIARALEHYELDGFAEIEKDGHKKLFGLNSKGSFLVLSELVEMERRTTEEIVLIRFILKAYGKTLSELLLRDLTPDITKEKVERLLDVQEFLHNQINLIETAQRKVDNKVRDYASVCTFIDKEIKPKGRLTKEELDMFNSRFTHRLSHRKSYKELFLEMPTDLREREVKEGFHLRKSLYLEEMQRVLDSEKQGLLRLVELEAGAAGDS